MLSEKVRNKILSGFAKVYPSIDKRAVVIVREDGKVRVLNAKADNILFDNRGNKVVPMEMRSQNSVMAAEATYETLP